MIITISGIELELPEGSKVDIQNNGKKVKVDVPVVEKIRVVEVEKIRVVEAQSPHWIYTQPLLPYQPYVDPNQIITTTGTNFPVQNTNLPFTDFTYTFTKNQL